MTEKDDGDPNLDCGGARHSLWLVKVPKYIATKWMGAPNGQPVGKLRIGKNMGRTHVSFSLDESLAREDSSTSSIPNSQSTIPTEHKFSLRGIGPQSLAVFSQTNNNPNGIEMRAIEGRVVQKADCMPEGGSKYMQLKMSQIVLATKPSRTAEQLPSAVKNVYKPVANVREELQYEKDKKAEGKRSRGDKEVVMGILFKAFEKHQYYNIRDLVKITQQPVTFLKELLREIGNYNVKNPHKNMWELKPEYRHHENQDKDDSAMDSS